MSLLDDEYYDPEQKTTVQKPASNLGCYVVLAIAAVVAAISWFLFGPGPAIIIGALVFFGWVFAK